MNDVGGCNGYAMTFHVVAVVKIEVVKALSGIGILA